MKSKIFSLIIFSLLAVRPEPTSEASFTIATFLIFKIQNLITRTIRARQRGNRVRYAYIPGQAVAESAAQALRYFSFVVEMFLVVITWRIIAYMCETSSARNTVAAYTVVFTFVHCWEYILNDMAEDSHVNSN